MRCSEELSMNIDKHEFTSLLFLYHHYKYLRIKINGYIADVRFKSKQMDHETEISSLPTDEDKRPLLNNLVPPLSNELAVDASLFS